MVQDGAVGLSLDERWEKEERVVEVWLARFVSEQTRRAYARDISDWLAHLEGRERSLFSATLEDAISYQRLIALTYSDSSQARKIAAVKSLYSLMKKIGVTSINVFAVVRAPSVRNKLAHRILTESEVFRLFEAARVAGAVHRKSYTNKNGILVSATTYPKQDSKRNLALLHLLYYGPLRAQEASELTWGDLVERPDIETGQLQVFGKGGASRTCLLPSSIWQHLVDFRPEGADDTGPVFISQRKTPVSTNQIRRIVREIAKTAEIDKPVSPHWFRHAHASHADDRGASMVTICAQLGHKDPSTTYRYIHARPHDASSFYLPV